jgi:glycosyltransferase involved in cell wall biosynthesis
MTFGERIGELATKLARSALVRYVRAEPRRRDWDGAERRVHMLLMNAYGMDGTIRTTFNLAVHLASRGYEVVLLSVGRDRAAPFFGELPPGVSIVTLDDRREEMLPDAFQPLRRWLRERPSLFMHPDDIAAGAVSLWSEWRLVRALRRKAGFLVTTRPGLNLMAAFLSPPGLALVGQEHMHLEVHSESLQEAMTREYRKLSVLSVLTKRDRRSYRRHLDRKVPVVRIPNAVRDPGSTRADLSAKTVLAAGRLTRQKGFDRLIKAWELVAPEHPDWKLRICGLGPKRGLLQWMVRERGLEESVTLARPAQNLDTEMERASIFVLSSRWEGLPLVMLEAMSVGMAVVSFDCPTGPADLIDDHENGLLIKPRTIANLAAGIGEMIADEELRRRCAQGAIETSREYSMDLLGPLWEETLERAWERRAAKRARAAAAKRGRGRGGGAPRPGRSATRRAAAPSAQR